MSTPLIDNLRDLIRERGALLQIDRLATEAARLREALFDQVADDNYCRAE